MVIRILYLFLILLLSSCEELEIDEDSIFENECAQNYSACEELGNECENGNDSAFDLLGYECQNGNDNACDVLGNQCAQGSYYACEELGNECEQGNYYSCDELGDACEWGNSYACDILDAEEPIPGIISLDQYINGSTASFNWEGNKFAFSYSFRLESQSYEDPVGIYINWSDWSSDTLVTLENLDEGQYIFQVKSRFDEIEQSEPTTINFEVDAIPGPALRIYPLNQKANVGDEIDVYLYFEEVPEESAVTGLDIDIQINTDELEFITDEFQYGELITGFPGTTIYPDPSYSDDGASVSIVGVADSSGIGIYGTGSIARLRLMVKGQVGTFTILIYQAENAFQNIYGDAHGFNEPVSGSVTVEETGQ